MIKPRIKFIPFKAVQRVKEAWKIKDQGYKAQCFIKIFFLIIMVIS